MKTIRLTENKLRRMIREVVESQMGSNVAKHITELQQTADMLRQEYEKWKQIDNGSDDFEKLTDALYDACSAIEDIIADEQERQYNKDNFKSDYVNGFMDYLDDIVRN